MKAPVHLSAYGPHGRTVVACDRTSGRVYRITDTPSKVTCERCQRTELWQRRARREKER